MLIDRILRDESINWWIRLSIEYANTRSYLDDLFSIYHTIPEGIREINEDLWKQVEMYYTRRDDVNLIKTLLKFDKFPLKDPYVAYLRHDPTAFKRNPRTIRRIAGMIYELGLKELYKRCSEPKETNRQIGPMFKNWLQKGTLGLDVMSIDEFTNSSKDGLLLASDEKMKQFARDKLGYSRNKGLDFIARIRGKYIIGEAKFLTDYGGHQNAQFMDALSIFKTKTRPDVIKIAILDGVLYIPRNTKMFKAITDGEFKKENILSALVLRNFLFAI